MLEIKDKETSALEALGIAKGDPRLFSGYPLKRDLIRLVTHYLTIHGSPDACPDRIRTLDGLFCRFACHREHNRVRLSRAALKTALFFGGFQAGMTLAGWVAGTSVVGFISADDHWMAFVLLLVVGGKMMREGMQGEEEMARTNRMLRFIPLGRSPLLPASIPLLSASVQAYYRRPSSSWPSSSGLSVVESHLPVSCLANNWRISWVIKWRSLAG